MARGKLNQGTQTAQNVRVAVVAVIGAIFLAYGIYQVGRLFDVFASRYELVTMVPSSSGLIEGAPVTLAGQRVGQVDEIRFIPVEERHGEDNLYIRLSLNENVRDQIREDSEAALRTQGLLGDRFVDISPGSMGYAVMGSGDTIPSRAALDYEEVLFTAASTLEQVQQVVGGLSTMATQIEAGEGTLGALLDDDRLYDRMTVATTELAAMLRAINRSDGTFARMIRDPAMYDRMNGTLARLDSLGAVILDGDGTLGRLIRDDSLYQGLVGVVGRADSAMTGVQGLIGGIESGDGTLARLLEDPALYDQFLKTVVDLQNLIRAIREDPRTYRPEIRVDVF
jgi:phospholipid/cholesterol/gamma-HCH transport system substrate-binding protein